MIANLSKVVREFRMRGAMRPAEGRSLFAVLAPGDGERGRSAADAPDRRAVSGGTVLRRAPHGGGVAPGWLDGEPQAGATSDARDADRGDLPEAEHQPPSPGPYCLSLSFTRSGDRSAEPGMVRRHHLHPVGEGV